jgi:hypothetical protein
MGEIAENDENPTPDLPPPGKEQSNDGQSGKNAQPDPISERNRIHLVLVWEKEHQQDNGKNEKAPDSGDPANYQDKF